MFQFWIPNPSNLDLALEEQKGLSSSGKKNNVREIRKSDIQAKESIETGFMHRSKVACMGDMNIVKEIADTEVLLEGTFEMNKGRVLSSAICAKGGAKIYNIGSRKAKPSTRLKRAGNDIASCTEAVK